MRERVWQRHDIVQQEGNELEMFSCVHSSIIDQKISYILHNAFPRRPMVRSFVGFCPAPNANVESDDDNSDDV